jgi:hypothetical protein
MLPKILSVPALGLLLFPVAKCLYAQTPLTEASGTYSYKNQTFKLGLYEGTNTMPAEHLADGLEIAKSMRSLPKINIVIIGHSVPQTTFTGFNWATAKSQNNLAANTNFVSGAIAAKMAWDWVSEFKGTYKTIGGLAAADIHVLVVQLTWAPFGGPDSYEMNTALQTKIDSMSHDLERLAQNAKKNLPNLKMILFEADPWQNNHEPYHAYHEWFFYRQPVLDQIKGGGAIDLSYKGADAKAVWMDVGPYWWKANDNGSYYSDCCHLNSTGGAHFQDVWVKTLLQNPVANQWLSASPTVNLGNTLAPDSRAPKMNSLVTRDGIKVLFTLPQPERLGLSLVSPNGEVVVPLFERTYLAGENSVLLQTGKPLAPGSYIVRLKSGSTTKSQVMLVDK